MIYGASKRTTDFLLSFLGLFTLLPLVVLISILILVTSGRPVLYFGERTGRNSIPFKIIKFRTMIVGADVVGGHSTALNDFRLTPIGRILRSKKLDELPQLINVLKGDMSLVGPRPQVAFYTQQYSESELKILSVRPGITDLASLHFANMDEILGDGDIDKKYATEIEPIKNELRLKYVCHASFALDLKILFNTFLLFAGHKSRSRSAN